MQPKNYVCYCGLYCKLCTIVGAIPKQARALHHTMKRSGWEMWGSQVHKEFDDFWKVLQNLAQLDETCPLCEGGCGDPTCQIRGCAQEKGVRVCAQCSEFPCPLTDELSKRYDEIAINNARIREVGLEAWIAEQEALAAAGRYYGDDRE